MADTRRQDGLTAVMMVCTGVAIAAARLVPHPANFVPVGALGLFGGARLKGWWPFVLPLAVLLGSDCSLWAITGEFMYSPFHLSRAYVYTSFMLYVLIGKLVANRRCLGVITGAAVAGSLQFFLVTNFFDWLCQPLMDPAQLSPQFTYTRDVAGLLHCYAAALPFYRDEATYTFHYFIMGHPTFAFFGTLLGDIIFSLVLFGLAERIARTEPAKRDLDVAPAPLERAYS